MRRIAPLFTGAYDRARDILTRLGGGSDPLVPPRHLLRISTDPAADFRETGRALVRFLAAECGLHPGSSVLDVGCGVGRLAVALSEHLDQHGRYEGFDVVPREIAWCAEHISRAFPRFSFRLADLHSDTYRPDGAGRAADYRFPYEDGVFDVVVAASVFTHLLASDMEGYLNEISRVMAPGGRCLVSYYLMNDRAHAGIGAGTSAFAFAHDVDGCHVDRVDRPDLAVAHDEARVRDLFAQRGLVIDRIFFGTWPTSRAQDQDLIVARRTAHGSHQEDGPAVEP